MPSNPFRNIYRKCCNIATKYQRAVTILAAGSICASGDIMAQTFEAYQDVKLARKMKVIPSDQDVSIYEQTKYELKKRFDYQRLAAVATFGFCVSGPFGSVWYPTLDKFMRTKLPHFIPGSGKFVLTKVSLEQLIYGPVLTFLFFPVVSFVEGGDSWKTLRQRMKDDFWRTLLVDELAFTLIAPITYKFIPVHFQLIWTSSASAIENMFFSWVQHQGFPELDLPGLPWGGSDITSHQSKHHDQGPHTLHSHHIMKVEKDIKQEEKKLKKTETVKEEVEEMEKIEKKLEKKSDEKLTMISTIEKDTEKARKLLHALKPENKDTLPVDLFIIADGNPV